MRISTVLTVSPHYCEPSTKGFRDLVTVRSIKGIDAVGVSLVVRGGFLVRGISVCRTTTDEQVVLCVLSTHDVTT